MELLVFPLICMVLAGISVLRYYSVIGFPSGYTLLPYHGGVLYRGGIPVRAVAPGRQRVFVGREKILTLDKRPIQVSIEDRAVTLADGATAVFGYTMSAQLNDPIKAIYASTNYNNIPAFVSLCVTRLALNQCQVDQIAAGRKELEGNIVAQCRSRLGISGFELLSFRITQIGIAAAAPQRPQQYA